MLFLFSSIYVVNLFAQREMGVLSTIDNTITIMNLKDAQQYNSISSWKINDYIEQKVLEEFKGRNSNIKIIPFSYNKMILPDIEQKDSEVIRQIMIDNKIDTLISIENNYQDYPYGLIYFFKMYEPYSDDYVDMVKLNIQIRIYELTKSHHLIHKFLYNHFIGSTTVLTKNKGEKLFQYPVKIVDKKILEIMEQPYKKFLSENILNVLRNETTFKLLK